MSLLRHFTLGYAIGATIGGAVAALVFAALGWFFPASAFVAEALVGVWLWRWAATTGDRSAVAPKKSA